MNIIKNLNCPSGSIIQSFLHSGNYEFPDYLFFQVKMKDKK